MIDVQAEKDFAVVEAGSSFLSRNFKKLQMEYPDQFVAIENSEVIESADSCEVIIKKLEERNKGPQQVIVEFIPSKDAIIVY